MPAVLAVEAVPEPERDRVLQETVAVEVPDRLVAALGEIGVTGGMVGKVRPEVNRQGEPTGGSAASCPDAALGIEETHPQRLGPELQFGEPG
jgi:hypothetical protein